MTAALYAAIALPALWIVSSLVASWIVYDRLDLMRWGWIRQALNFHPDAWINIHAGLDESTPALRALFDHARWRASTSWSGFHILVAQGFSP